jgi:hypothetical protein
MSRHVTESPLMRLAHTTKSSEVGGLPPSVSSRIMHSSNRTLPAQRPPWQSASRHPRAWCVGAGASEGRKKREVQVAGKRARDAVNVPV